MRTFTKVLFAALAVLMVGIMPARAHADAIGDTVNLKFYYPNGSTLYGDYGNKIVSASTTEYPIFMNIDVTGTQIITTFIQTGYISPSGTFVGFYLNDLTKAFNSVALNVLGTTAVPVTGYGLNSAGIFLNMSGMNVVAGQKITLDFTNAAAVTPEPSSLVLLGTGLLGVVGAARRRFMTA